jgi:hypothetical protein
MRNPQRPRREQRGAALITVALCMVVLMLIIAIVIDLGATRSDRRAGQAAIDAAVASAGKTFAESSIGPACLAGLGYLQATLDSGPFVFTSGSCSTFTSTMCADASPQSAVAKIGPYEVTIEHPVIDTSPIMQGASVIGGGAIPLVANDIGPCDRIGMKLTTTNGAFFGEIGGQSSRKSSVHAVAALNGEPGELRPINLLVLNRTKCDALTVGGATTKVVIASPKDEPDEPGVIGLDSDGTASPSCNGGKTTVSIDGSGGQILAKGPCTSSASTDCGRIDLYAGFGDGDCMAPNIEADDVPGCNEGQGTITPNATASPTRYTRSPVEYQYNCKSAYGPGPGAEAWWGVQPIPGCPHASDSQPHVDQLLAFAEGAMTSVPAGWTVITNCNPTSIDYPAGNYFVDCGGGTGYKVGGTVRFTGGNVIFRGKVDVTGGTLAFNSSVFDKNQWSSKAAWVYANNDFGVGSANLQFNNTSLFLGSSGKFTQNSDGASVSWTAPDEGTVDDSAGPFDDLALWTEGTDVHTFRGGGSSYFEGMFFGGLAPFAFSGGNNLTLDEAQFVADTLSFSGGATFTMSPVGSRTLDFPIDPTFTLIR